MTPRESYRACREINRAYGRTYYLSTLLLPAWKRPYVHALYAFARYADEIVDDLASPEPPAERARRLETWGERFLAGLREGVAPPGPIGPAIVDTAQRWQIPVAHFEAFLASMRMDLTVTGYDTYDDLLRYTYGSAAVIGRQMLPILEPVAPGAAPYAEDLGTGFQLVNFVRDVGEDLRRGRVYLPAEDLDRFGVTRADLGAEAASPRVRALLAFEAERARAVLDRARPGIALLHPTSRPAIETALVLYGGILDEAERAGYQVLRQRVRVGPGRKARVAARGLLRAYAARARSRDDGSRHDHAAVTARLRAR